MTTKASLIDLNGNEMILDADGDTTITADTDDQIDFKVGGSDTVHMGLTTYNASDRIVLTNTSGNASMAIVAGTSGESSIFMADGTSGDASYRGYLQYQHANDNWNFGTAATLAMKIDSSGRVTKPLQPYTAAYNNANQTVSAVTWTDWAINTDLETNGTSMRTATSTITFPVAGVYLCTGVISIQSVNATNYALARAIFGTHGTMELGIFEKVSDNDYGYDVPINFMVKVVANDTMKLQTFSGSGTHIVRGGTNSHLEVMLIG